MLFHASLPADDPLHVARVLAELWAGEFLPFPPFPDAFVVLAGDERRTVLDAYPRGREHAPATREYALARRERWSAQRSERGGLFTVIEFWVENKFLLEVLTAAEQRRYVENLTSDNLRATFGL